jgi:hypothetical protein
MKQLQNNFSSTSSCYFWDSFYSFPFNAKMGQAFVGCQTITIHIESVADDHICDH